MRPESATVTPPMALRVTAPKTALRAARGVLAALALAAVAACASKPAPQAKAGAGSGGSARTTATTAPKVDPNAPVTIALLAPTTAASDGVRRAAQDLVAAAQMARSDRAPANFLMKVYDTRGDDAGAAEAAAHAVRDGAAIILGPLLASSTRAAAPVAKRAGLNILSFSNDATVAGDNVWILGQTPGDEMRRVFGYVASQGAGSVAVAYPDNRYGQRVAEEAPDAARDAGIGLAALAAYPYAPQRGRGNFDQISESGGEVAAQISSSGADAVLLADVGSDLASLGSFLNYFDVSPKRYRYIGLSRWGTQATLREPSLEGGVYAAASPESQGAFERAFAGRMSRNPSTVAGIGYDAVVAASDMLTAAQSGGGAAFDARAITAAGHSGATGDFVLTADGGNRRALAIIQVAADGFRVIEPAPGIAPGS